MVERTRGRPSLNDSSAIADEKLLDAVLIAFGENGFEGTSVREIARRLKVSHNLIPQRFGSKKRLWYTAVDYGFARVRQELIIEAETLGTDDLLVLRGLLVRSIEIYASHPSLLKIVNQEASHPGVRLDYLFDTVIRPVRDFGEKWLNQLIEQGRIRPTSVTLLYFMLTYGAGGLFTMPALTNKLNSDKKDVSIRVQAEMAVNVIFDGLSID
ncbi:MAG: TetR/AcrR family transcriptional regulator [Oceanicoccus sp.]|jgi:TetR/AcrR family transcriptional regulator